MRGELPVVEQQQPPEPVPVERAPVEEGPVKQQRVVAEEEPELPVVEI